MEITSSMVNQPGQAGNVQSEFLKEILDAAEQNKTTTGREVPNNNLGKDEFLTLLLTQLQNQDPTDPMDDKAFISEMAQFTSMEQMTELNQNFRTYSDGQETLFGTLNQTLTNLSTSSQMSGLFGAIGKYVSLNDSVLKVQGGKLSTTASMIAGYNGEVQARVTDSADTLVRSENLGEKSRGDKELWDWDGMGDNGSQVGDGEYKIQFYQRDSSGSFKPISTDVLGYVFGVTLSEEGPQFRIGDNETVSLSEIKEVAI